MIPMNWKRSVSSRKPKKDSDVRTMNEIGIEATIASLRQLCARLEALRHLEMADLLLPGRQKHYEQTLEDAYASLAQVETAVDELSQELEYHHQRLGNVVDLNPEEWEDS